MQSHFTNKNNSLTNSYLFSSSITLLSTAPSMIYKLFIFMRIVRRSFSLIVTNKSSIKSSKLTIESKKGFCPLSSLIKIYSPNFLYYSVCINVNIIASSGRSYLSYISGTIPLQIFCSLWASSSLTFWKSLFIEDASLRMFKSIFHYRSNS